MARRLALVSLLICLLACDAPPPGDSAHAHAAAAAYDRFRRPDALVAALDLRPGSRVADVGAGAGYLTLRLAAAVGPTGRVTATDVDAAALAQLAVAPAAAPIATRVVTAGDPGLEAAAYDLVLLAEVDHLLPDRTAYLRRLAAALAPGGRLAVTNRMPYLAAVRAAAAAAGIHELTPSGPGVSLPAHFLVFFGASP